MTNNERVIHEFSINTAKAIASMRCLILIWSRRPECVQRAKWAVEFDRECDRLGVSR